MWFDESVIYHIYPLGFCGAPAANDGVVTPRICKVSKWAEHIKKLGCTAVYFGPLMESGTHGYDTYDYRKTDARLGTDADTAAVCANLHKNGLKVIFDGVFNHVGRGFFAFRDVLENKQNSRYKDWFYIHFDANSCYNDGFWYEGWEGHFELVKLNLKNPEVTRYLIDSVGEWIKMFGIDGLRLDVAYMLDGGFLWELKEYCKAKKKDFFLLGEMIHGDYNRLLGMIDSVTNYECYKGLYSAFNSMNMFEIGHSLTRQFGSEPWCLYRGRNLASFADNHDVTRLASILTRSEHIIPLYGLMFGMPGIPMIYYGSEWGAKGEKKDGDASLRPAFDSPLENEVFYALSRFASVHTTEKALCYGDFKIAHMTNRQIALSRSYNGETVTICVNADSVPFSLPRGTVPSEAKNLLTNEIIQGDSITLGAFSVAYMKK